MGILRREEINQSQSNMKRIIDCNRSIFYGVRFITPIVNDLLDSYQITRSPRILETASKVLVFRIYVGKMNFIVLR